MLGWMLRRGENAPEPVNEGDTTQIDVPDTPAPVFAARAFKSALFGTPARPSNQPTRALGKGKNARMDQESSRTPQRPQGILLTPGTGTTRRKRVSFGQDVKKNANSNKEPESRQRTRLNEALEKASKSVNQKNETQQEQEQDNSSDEWEEADDEDYCAHDITIDLNEPHSQSGRYWKEEFEKYHEDAKAEMEKLLKYKQLAKSYAKQKDAEANELAVKLKEEQQKVIEMEQQIAEGASKIASKRGVRSDESSADLLSTLTKQTALAVQYRTRVQELEDQLEQFLCEREDDPNWKDHKGRVTTSPRTQKTLLETQSQLRRARMQVKEVDDLREQISSLKTQLKAAEKRAAKAEANSETKTSPKEKTDNEPLREGSRAQELRTQLREAREENKKKDEELRVLKQEFEAYRNETQAHNADTNAVLERAHAKIAELKKEVKTLKAVDHAAPEQEDHAARPKSWHVQSDAGRLAEEGSGSRNVQSNEDIRDQRRTMARRSFDLSDLEGDTMELKTTDPNVPSLRQKFSDDAVPRTSKSDVGTSNMVSSSLGSKPDIGRPRWQPFVPRSPRNRAYLGEEIAKRIENGGETPGRPKFEEITVPDLPALAKSVARSKRTTSTEKMDEKIDLLQDHYARVGGPDPNNSVFTANASKLPPERRAAAIARIEQRMAEKKRMRGRKGFDKENVRP
ncbi:hypothetical protein FPOAC2_08491 [Fusarium poae]|uniref:Spindle pole body-associated protein cut12 domain-containing protein n=1 Tax=Fusarium poae TaxID=36050 RepID=A0A1B8ALJ9_FUSPO|nr:hypothetical protein FPOAC1_008564 [Fusarium poae]KAG8669176.1 hypothetical protein FPOAC1_008564 [Fusarium poae]OBS21402.1 hypothetical protein FPOA_07740 [Fusarium poae]